MFRAFDRFGVQRIRKSPMVFGGSTGKRELAIVQLSWVSFLGHFACGEDNRISFEMIFP